MSDNYILSELSKRTLGAYTRVAAIDANTQGIKLAGSIHSDDRKGAKDAQRKSFNRIRGIGRATDRLTKEDVAEGEVVKFDPKKRVHKPSGGYNRGAVIDLKSKKRLTKESLAYVVGKGKLDTITGDKKNKVVMKTDKMPKKAANNNGGLRLVHSKEEFEVVDEKLDQAAITRIHQDKLSAIKKLRDNPDDPAAQERVAELRKKLRSMRTKTVKEGTLDEDSELAASRLRVRRAKLKKKLETNPHDVDAQFRMGEVSSQLKNLKQAMRARDQWAQTAEKDFGKGK